MGSLCTAAARCVKRIGTIDRYREYNEDVHGSRVVVQYGQDVGHHEYIYYIQAVK